MSVPTPVVGSSSAAAAASSAAPSQPRSHRSRRGATSAAAGRGDEDLLDGDDDDDTAAAALSSSRPPASSKDGKLFADLQTFIDEHPQRSNSHEDQPPILQLALTRLRCGDHNEFLSGVAPHYEAVGGW